METKIIIDFFERDLNKLKEEINLYKNEFDLWKVEKEIKNSTGNLTLHIIGNLNHFIGAILGNTGYVRERDKEFSDSNILASKMIKEIDAIIILTKKIVSKYSDEELQQDYPQEFLGKTVSNTFILIQLLVHLNYHLGQINYHRRLTCK
ncbi:MAG: DUF1572 family protein [Bacteroidetes bacterium]|nr:DUF1572 family protein [Bacteroidota bacterium]